MNTKKTTLHIKGMHCSSCEVLLERVLKKQQGVISATLNHARGEAVLLYTGSLDHEKIKAALKVHGYVMTDHSVHHSASRYILELVIAIALISIIYVGSKTFNLFPSSFGISENMSYGIILGMGLIASFSSCAATAGGLLMAYTSRFSEKNQQLSAVDKFKPQILFNIGRIVSYTFFGMLLGTIGSLFKIGQGNTGILYVIVSVVMILLGIQLLDIFPTLRWTQIRMPKKIAHVLHDAVDNYKQATPLALGAITFFVPCGFTQGLQIYVLGKGDPIIGAASMFVFALGTVPGLLSLGFLTTYLKGFARSVLLKVAGVFIIYLAIISLQNGLVLSGVATTGPETIKTNFVPMENGVQIIDMKVIGLDYEPAHFVVRRGIPVEWRIDGSRAAGCAQVISASKIGVNDILPRNSVWKYTFTPNEPGSFTFSCGMGMAGPGRVTII